MHSTSLLKAARLIAFCAVICALNLTLFPTLPAQAQGPVLVGASDIASCGSQGDEKTADLLDKIDGVVFTAGDTVQGEGTPEYFEQCYTPSWGRHKARTRPALGNHDYSRGNADAFFAYFGENAGPPGLGYYSYGLGEWKIIVLNSMIPATRGSPQDQWLRAELASTPPCTIAIWHHPIFSSGAYGFNRRMQNVWRLLYNAGVDIVINGDAHHYERFALQDPDGRKDPEHGIRQFIVGTGGAALTPLGKRWATTEARQNSTWGVLKLTLGSGSYTWEFIPVEGGEFTDSGSAPCVNPKAG